MRRKPARTGRRAAALQRLIAERIQDFDVPALIEVLTRRLRYKPTQIEFRSHRSTVHQSHLVHAIEFLPGPPRHVIVSVNLGLLSIQTPLPSFFFQEMDRLDQDKMETFIGYFDDLLLRERFLGLYPERNESLLPRWRRSTKDRLSLLRLASPSSLHWAFAKVFPEAEVKVQRALGSQRVESRGIQLGSTALGDDTSMGGFARVPMGGLEVWLYVDQAHTGNGQPWAEEAERRLFTHVLPHLTEANLPLTVILVLRDQNSYARIHGRSYLGYDPIQGGPDHPQQVILFSGVTSDFVSTRGV